ncbi:MAG: mechanosensitive ion channel family protein [Geminicoccaceae bacterium]|nr:mechanosensitive ion channel family protein [Geminicoccaceae bacterium]
MRRLVAPFLVLVATVVAAWLLPATWVAAERSAQVLAWLAGTWLLVRFLDVTLWHGLLERRTGSAPPRLLTDLLAALLFVAVALLILAEVFDLPLTHIVTTSSVLVAVIGFALRDMLASLFAGIALNVEKPYSIGDWIEVAPGKVGRVVEVGWLTTRLVTKEKVGVVVPNAHLATQNFENYGHRGQLFRSQVTLTLDHQLRPARVERVLLAAVRGVPEVGTAGPGPDLKIVSFDGGGVTWQVRFWLDDYDRLQEMRYAVQRSLLQHLHQAGIALPYTKVDLFHARMPERDLDTRRHRDRVLGRSELFRKLAAEELARLAADTTERRYSSGDVVVRQGAEDRSLFVVLEGVLDVQVEAEDGGSRSVNRLTPGSMFGEFALLTGAPRSATVRAAAPAVLLEITEEAIAPVLKRCPELAEELSRVLAERQALTRDSANRPPNRSERRGEQDRLLDRIRALFGI